MENKERIYYGIRPYKITPEGKREYTLTEKEKKQFIDQTKINISAGVEFVFTDNQESPHWNLIDTGLTVPVQPKVEQKDLMTDDEINTFIIDENDLTLIKILKSKFVRMQNYEAAAELRHLEKEMTWKIEYVKLHRELVQKAKLDEEYKDFIDFGNYIQKNFNVVSCWTESTNPPTQIFNYVSKDKSDEFKKYTTQEVYAFYRLNGLKENIENLKEKLK